MNGMNFVSSSCVAVGYSPVILLRSILFRPVRLCSTPLQSGKPCSILFQSSLFYLVPIRSILVNSLPTCPGLIQPVLSPSSFILFHVVLVYSVFFFLPFYFFLSMPYYSWFYSMTFCSSSFHLLHSERFILILPHSISSCPRAFFKVLEYLLCAQSLDEDL